MRPLAVAAGGGQEATDWMQLSRKHVVEVDADARHVSIFGGKLTDCLNVGEEVARRTCARSASRCPYPEARWYGEPPAETRARVLPPGAR